MQYTPRSSPKADDLESIRQWVEGELNQIAQSFQEQDLVLLIVLNVAPPKPREGMIVFADGTHWNPGSGRGFYGYRSGSWRKMD